MQAVILAGGKGTRLHPLTSKTPKPMVRLFDRPVLEHTIRLLKKHGVKDVILTLAYKPEQIMDYFGNGSKLGVNIQYLLEDTPKGTAGGLRTLQPILKNTFLVLSGDAVTDFDLSSAIDFHRKKSAIATLLVYQVDDPSQFGIVEHTPDGLIQRFMEKPKPSETFSNVVNTGIYVLEPDIISYISCGAACDFSRNVFPRLLQNREQFFCCRADGYWCDIGNLGQYRNAHFDAMTGKVKLDIPAAKVAKGVWITEDADIHPTVKLLAPLYVGGAARISRQASLGRFAVVGGNTRVSEQSKVTQSILDSGVSLGKCADVFRSIVGSGYEVAENLRLADEVVVHGGPDS